MYQFLVLILFLFFISKYTEGYINYEELTFQGTEQNCPQQHANNYHKLVNQTKLKDFFGDYSNQYSNCGSFLSDEYIGQCSDKIDNTNQHDNQPNNTDKSNNNTDKSNNNTDKSNNNTDKLDNQPKSTYQMIQPFGYTKNELLHNTRFIQTDIPLPTDPDFFKHI